MSSLFMGAVNYGGVPADERVVRNTATPYQYDAPAAMAPSAPDTNQLETDGNPNLGMTSRQMASTWVEGSRAEPQSGTLATQNASNQIIAEQVSTSGTAAQREMSGETHKNASYAVGIEPQFDLADPNHKMGNTYFVREERQIQEPAGRYMSQGPGQDHAIMGNINAYGKDAARQAADAGLYRTWWAGMNG